MWPLHDPEGFRKDCQTQVCFLERGMWGRLSVAVEQCFSLSWLRKRPEVERIQKAHRIHRHHVGTFAMTRFMKCEHEFQAHCTLSLEEQKDDPGVRVCHICPPSSSVTYVPIHWCLTNTEKNILSQTIFDGHCLDPNAQVRTGRKTKFCLLPWIKSIAYWL